MNPQRKSLQKKKLGKLGEDFAVQYLRSLSYRILKRNFLIRYGEIDIICMDKQTLVFVEVKTRIGHAFGYPEESVTPSKLREVCKTSQYYVLKQHLEHAQQRIDVIAIDMSKQEEVMNLRHIKNVTGF